MKCQIHPARVGAIVLLVGLAACSSDNMARTLGLQRNSPDEFTVTTRSPLSMPANYDLTRPVPGAPRPQERSVQQSAAADLTPSLGLSGAAATDSPGQYALVAQAGPTAPADIRDEINKRAVRINSNGGVGNTLAFWKSTPPPGQVLDPKREAVRLYAASEGDAKARQAKTPLLSQ